MLVFGIRNLEKSILPFDLVERFKILFAIRLLLRLYYKQFMDLNQEHRGSVCQDHQFSGLIPETDPLIILWRINILLSSLILPGNSPDGVFIK